MSYLLNKCCCKDRCTDRVLSDEIPWLAADEYLPRYIQIDWDLNNAVAGCNICRSVGGDEHRTYGSTHLPFIFDGQMIDRRCVVEYVSYHDNSGTSFFGDPFRHQYAQWRLYLTTDGDFDHLYLTSPISQDSGQAATPPQIPCQRTKLNAYTNLVLRIYGPQHVGASSGAHDLPPNSLQLFWFVMLPVNTFFNTVFNGVTTPSTQPLNNITDQSIQIGNGRSCTTTYDDNGTIIGAPQEGEGGLATLSCASKPPYRTQFTGLT